MNFNKNIFDLKIKETQDKIFPFKRTIFDIIFTKLEQLEILYLDKLQLIKYISYKIKPRLLEFEKEKKMLNKLVFASEIWKVTDLEVFNQEFSIWSKDYFILRKFKQNNLEKYLVVEDKTYNTFVINSEYIKDKEPFWEIYNNSSYKKNLDLVYKNRTIKKWKKYLQNAWLKSALNKEKNNIYLTADFCPSYKKWFEDKIIEKFINKWNNNIWIAITSVWINWHKKDFQKLIQYKNSWLLNITWINHTKTHKYNYSHDYSTTFILTPGLVLEDEILDVEKKLIENAQTPSIFLRFPWLISNEKIFKAVIYKYWLIPLWANAWLAKWEKIKNNSIILIHWNKNEPRWIVIFDKILNKKSSFYYDSLNNILDK